MLIPRAIFPAFFALPLSLVAAAPDATLPADHAERMARGLVLFQKDVRGLLQEHCLKCHGGEKTKGELDLSTREDLLKGGKNGPAIVPFNAKSSLLYKLINHQEEPEMPDKKPKLPDAVIAKFEAWLNDGAPYSDPLVAGKKPGRDRSKVTDEDRKWWAFLPLAKMEGGKRDESAIDGLLLNKAKEKGLSFAPAADKRTLIRRAYFDLLGLPPSPEEVESFVNNPSPNAWPELIDRLLDSPHYGERWGRHWLDVARFAESSGFEHDYDRDGAYFYRDFVIKALNSDMPYNQFVRWQLAGDEFEPENPLALTATGFLGAGVFPTQITANEVERTRYDAMDDMLSTTASAMLGLTVGCARCHDHKYDPIPTRDYYQLLSTFTTTVRSNIEIEMDPEKARAEQQRWEAGLAPLTDAVKKHEIGLRGKFDAWVAAGLPDVERAAWTLPEVKEIKSKAGATFKNLGDGSWLAEGTNGNEDEYTITLQSGLRRITGLRLETLAHESLPHKGPGRAGNGNFGLGKITISATPLKGGPAREVKLVKAIATHEQNNKSLSIAATLDDNPKTGWAVDGQIGKDQAAVFVFAEPLDIEGGASLTVKLEFKLNTQHNIGRPRFSLIADAEPTLKGEAMPPKIAEISQHRQEPDFLAKLTPKDKDALFDWWKRRDVDWRKLTASVDGYKAKKPGGGVKILMCGEGNKPLRMHTQGADFFNETFILKRGNTDLKDGVASQNFLQVLMRQSDPKVWQWTPPAGAKVSGRRRTLSNWLTDVDRGAGTLLARVIVNRLWQHHFGTGIVATPNDFGKSGTPPANPELLDWLANQLIQGGWKLKPLHKLMMVTAAYQQSAVRDVAKEIADPSNSTFTRRIPHRLEAEAIRDSILAVGGVLDSTMFGPGTRDERSKRRSIYFNIKRSQLIGSMVAFDAPEPLVSQGLRPTTTVAPQALLIMNSPQVREWAEAFAGRVSSFKGLRVQEFKGSKGQEESGGEGGIAANVARAYALAFNRSPSAEESRDAVAFLQAQTAGYASAGKSDGAAVALADFCQVLLGLNEFVYEP